MAIRNMTANEQAHLDWLVDHLQRTGYPTYASILQKFDLHLTNDGSTVGYMVPEKGYIVLNTRIEEDQVSAVVRHEIMHFFLEHTLRGIHILARQKGLKPDKLDDVKLKDLTTELFQKQFYDPEKNANLPLFNYIADYEISNLVYDDWDKDTLRNLKNIRFDGDIITCLVTEDDHPDWVNLSMEEMYRKIISEYPGPKKMMQVITGKLIDNKTFGLPDGRIIRG